MKLKYKKTKKKARTHTYLIIITNKTISIFVLKKKTRQTSHVIFRCCCCSFYEWGNNDTCVHMLSILIVFGVRVRIYINSLEHIRLTQTRWCEERTREGERKRCSAYVYGIKTFTRPLVVDKLWTIRKENGCSERGRKRRIFCVHIEKKMKQKRDNEWEREKKERSEERCERNDGMRDRCVIENHRQLTTAYCQSD